MIACHGDVIYLRHGQPEYEHWATVCRRGHPVYRHQRPDEEPFASPRSLEYYFFFNAERRENVKSKPPERGYNLADVPEDICFYLAVR